jgi:hypothetical protein
MRINRVYKYASLYVEFKSINFPAKKLHQKKVINKNTINKKFLVFLGGKIA